MAFRLNSKSVHIISTALMLFISNTAYSSSPISLEKQRTLYAQAQQLLDDKNIIEFLQVRGQLNDYALTPYLDYRIFSYDLDNKSSSEVVNFISKYEDFPFSQRVKASYLNSLATQKKWSTFLALQQYEPTNESYRCHYYHAYYQSKQHQLAFKGAKALWLNGRSVSDACTPLFRAWDSHGKLTDDLILQRMMLAFDKSNLSLMQYLQKMVDAPHEQQLAESLVALYKTPENVVSFARTNATNPFAQEAIVMAMNLLARKDTKQAYDVYHQLANTQLLDKTTRQKAAEHIARRWFDVEDPSLMQWRDRILMQSKDDNLIEQRLRLAIQQTDWNNMTHWISALSEDTRNSPRWQYWQARTDMRMGNKSQGEARLNAILGLRDFYSAAAAEALKKPITYPNEQVSLNMKLVAPFQKTLARIEELIYCDRIAAAKTEWRWLLEQASHEQKYMLTAYAASKNWHSLTITGSIMAKMWDHISLRFPFAHRGLFELYGKKVGLNPITLTSVARQESAMDPQVQSPAGARGLMQIMPKTAEYTAKKHQISYTNSADLYNVHKNIEIGSHYLSDLMNQYNNNRVFALAAYNAGPSRVSRWRDKSNQSLDVFAFIETIPFRETRGYVQNILMFEVYYRGLIGAKGSLFYPHEFTIKY